MAKFQLLTCYVNLAGERGNVVYRGPDNPITLPEAAILAVVHGGEEHVHTMIVVGEVERSSAEEMDRLRQKYGAIADKAFPAIGNRIVLPERDENLPTKEEVAAGEKARKEAMDAVRSGDKPAQAKSKKSKKAETSEDETNGSEVPSLAELNKE